MLLNSCEFGNSRLRQACCLQRHVSKFAIVASFDPIVLIGARALFAPSSEIQYSMQFVDIVEVGAFCEIAALVLSSLTQKRCDTFDTKTIHLIDRSKNGQTSSCVCVAAKVDGFHQAIQHLAVIHLDDIVAALNAQSLHRIRRHHADLGIGRHRGASDRIGIELHELPEASRPRLFVAKHPALAIAAIGLGQRVEILRDITRQRRGQVIAQRQPLLVVVLEREHAFVRPVLIGQELAERVGIFDRGRLHRLEAVEFIDGANFLQHRARCGEFGRGSDPPARAAAAPSLCLLLSVIALQLCEYTSLQYAGGR